MVEEPNPPLRRRESLVLYKSLIFSELYAPAVEGLYCYTARCQSNVWRLLVIVYCTQRTGTVYVLLIICCFFLFLISKKISLLFLSYVQYT
jgi:hypothetical protein